MQILAEVLLFLSIKSGICLLRHEERQWVFAYANSKMVGGMTSRKHHVKQEMCQKDTDALASSCSEGRYQDRWTGAMLHAYHQVMAGA